MSYSSKFDTSAERVRPGPQLTGIPQDSDISARVDIRCTCDTLTTEVDCSGCDQGKRTAKGCSNPHCPHHEENHYQANLIQARTAQELDSARILLSLGELRLHVPSDATEAGRSGPGSTSGVDSSMADMETAQDHAGQATVKETPREENELRATDEYRSVVTNPLTSELQAAQGLLLLAEGPTVKQTKKAARDRDSYDSDDTIPDETSDTTISACSCGINQNNGHSRDSSRDQATPASSPPAPRHPDLGF
ncbi:hypothetical protein N3K66_000907 [Trichothecium roseum]|uniref:Uncharacterized protein n=1 Tax=Trichothecium roseum TaxID=47278 RepID=A0ACC0VE40_9HYPO|nr:hypothetical protein N3K66_000907 [Trichothecium roseum]